MNDNSLTRLEALGQSLWLDYISRDLITGGKLRRLIVEDGLSGMTSNPAIFEKAISGSGDYDADIARLGRRAKGVIDIYEELALTDVRSAADVFRPVYDATAGLDGYVSLEVNPHLAHDTAGTVAEARRLWAALSRPNVFIKVPATKEGLPAIETLIAEGINVNVTLIFGLPRYREVAQAYIRGLEARSRTGGGLEKIASVASFFISRIDSLVDQKLETMMTGGTSEADLARRLLGQIAIDSARLAYIAWREMFGDARFKALAARGARGQRLLWASTSTKNPAYPDVKYVEALIGPETVNTMPMETIDAYRDHGRPEARLERDRAEAGWALRGLAELGIDIDEVTQRLEDEGVDKFNKPFDALLDSLGKAAARIAEKVS